jgi:hypothetical protein
MPLDFIPRQDDSFKAWFDTFTDYAQAHAVALGLSPAQIAELVAKRDAWDAGFGRHIEARNAAMGATAEKDRLRKEAEQMIRFCSGYIQRRRETTNDQRVSLGLRIPDRKPTPLSPDAVRLISPPSLVLDWSKRGQVTIHFGPNPSDEHRNGLPEGVKGVRLWWAPADPEKDLDHLDWEWLADDTHSPYLHVHRVPGTVFYRAQYLDRKLRLGPLGGPVSASVTL